MEARPRELFFYRTPDGKAVVEVWLQSIHDRKTRARLLIRLDRLENGLFGDSLPVGEGVVELREHFGPGYRIYVAPDGKKIVVLLCGGEKASQARDIKTAQQYWKKYTDGRKPRGSGK